MVKKISHRRYKPKIKKFLEEKTCPFDVEKIRVAVGIGHWQTCLKHCLELLILGEVRGRKTSKSWVFWVEEKSLNVDQETNPSEK